MTWILLTFPAPILLWVTYSLYRYASRVRDLLDLPGPPVVSYIWGDIFTLKKAPVGTLWRSWTNKYGPTYVIHECFMVSTLNIMMLRSSFTTDKLASRNRC